MNFAYGWAFSKPVRKVYYNITITALSVAVALIIGTIELVSILTDKTGITSGPLAAIATIDLDLVGYAIVALFVLAWLVALARLEVRPDRGEVDPQPAARRVSPAGQTLSTSQRAAQSRTSR